MLNMQGEQDFSTPALLSSIESSLKRLSCDYIDLLQLHDAPVDLANNGELIQEISKLKSKGIIRAIGITVKKPEDGLCFLNPFWDSILCKVNLIDQRAVISGLVVKAMESKISIISRTPLAFGFLTGKYLNSPVNLPPGDHRLRWSTKQLRLWADAPSLFKDILIENQRNMNELALKFCCSFESVSSTIPGMLTPKEVIDNAKISNFRKLTRAELDKIFLIYQNNSFFE
jgi:aryl-alcohol dehydrogenase-like predicted oxidoreductase